MTPRTLSLTQGWLIPALCAACPAVTAAQSATHPLPDSLLSPLDTVALVAASTGGSCEGPSVAPDGTLYYSELDTRALFRVLPDGEWGRYLGGSDRPNGTAVDVQGRLLVCDRGRVWRWEATEGPVETVALIPGRANDITLLPNGGMFVTMPVWDGLGEVAYIDPWGNARIVLDSLDYFPNGIEYVHELRQVMIAFTRSGDIRRYDVDTAWGLRDAGVTVAAGSPDGMTLDDYGNLWVANSADGRVDVFTTAGDTLGSFGSTLFNRSVLNCCFAGDTSHTLYIAAASGVFKIRTRVTGRNMHGGVVHLKAGRARGVPARASPSPMRVMLNGRLPLPRTPPLSAEPGSLSPMVR